MGFWKPPALGFSLLTLFTSHSSRGQAEPRWDGKFVVRPSFMLVSAQSALSGQLSGLTKKGSPLCVNFEVICSSLGSRFTPLSLPGIDIEFVFTMVQGGLMPGAASPWALAMPC